MKQTFNCKLILCLCTAEFDSWRKDKELSCRFWSVCCSMNTHTPWYVKNDTDERNARARKAYTALLTVTARTPNNEAYRNFSYEVSTHCCSVFHSCRNLLLIFCLLVLQNNFSHIKLTIRTCF